MVMGLIYTPVKETAGQSITAIAEFSDVPDHYIQLHQANKFAKIIV